MERHRDRTAGRGLLSALCVGVACLLAACIPQPPKGGGTPTTTPSTTSTTSTTTTAPPQGPGFTRVTAFPDAPSSGSVVSRNGRWVVFTSTTTQPSSGTDRNGAGTDVFRWDRTTGALVRVTSGNGPSQSPTVADDGTVAFESAATDLAGVDRNGDASDVFVWNGTTTRVTSATYPSSSPVISADGTRVALHSYGDLAGVGSGGAVLWNRGTGAFSSLKADELGQANLPQSASTNGSYVVLDAAGTLVLAEAGGASTTLATASFNAPITYVVPMAGVQAVADDGDVVYTVTTLYVHSTPPTIGSGSARRYDRQTGTTTHVGTSGVPIRIGQSGDGRWLVTTEVATNTGFAPGALGNVRLTDRSTSTVTLLTGAANAGTVSATGRWVAVDSNRTDLAGTDGNGAGLDVFLRDRGN